MVTRTKEATAKTDTSVSDDSNQNYGLIVGTPLGIVCILVLGVICFVFLRYSLILFKNKKILIWL